MDSYSFYKSLYDRELNRRKDLDSAINVPVTILTLIVGINSINSEIYKRGILNFIHHFEFKNVVLILISISFLTSIFYLIKSYNNLFRGFSYRNLAYTTELREFEFKQIPDYNNCVEPECRLDFQNELIKRMNSVTDNHISYNDQRSIDLYRAKTFTIITLILTGIQLVIAETIK
jgi:hypothetical protein